MRIVLLIVCFLTFGIAQGAIKVRVTNKTKIERYAETVEIPWSKIMFLMPNATAGNVIVVDNKGEQIPVQVTGDALLFQAYVKGRSTSVYRIDTGRQQKFPALTFGRLVPERKDDWAWENNRIAFRAYGPALEATGEISNGIDVWLKRTEGLIINKWYAAGNNYHSDKGEGLDCYKVGRTLGAGAMAPVLNNKFVLGNNFVHAELLDSGAIRTTVRLTYAPYKVGHKTINEQRVISLDAFSQMNRICETYSGDFDTLDVAAAIVISGDQTPLTTDRTITYAQQNESDNGITYLALVMPQKSEVRIVENHIAAITKVCPDQAFTYLSGAGWSKSNFQNLDQWRQYVKDELVKLDNPLLVELLKY